MVVLKKNGDVISIHAPRVGCDTGRGNPSGNAKAISIHAPRVGCDATEWVNSILRL